MGNINRNSMFSCNDELFITAMSGKETLMKDYISGFSTIGDVFKHVKQNVGESNRIIMLYLRNTTQGWSRQHTLVLTSKSN